MAAIMAIKNVVVALPCDLQTLGFPVFGLAMV